MHIKICGITNLEDALAAVDAGADLLGFNFYPPSPRYIDPPACAHLVAALRGQGAAVALVGVFVNTPAPAVAHILDDCGLDLAQLHGDEPPSELEALAPRAFKAIRAASLADAEAAAARYAVDSHGPRPALLLDAARPGHYGGTGRLADWMLARAVADRLPVLLAGGLTPENVGSALAQVHPWGVDVASGVEHAPGKKDRRKMAAFIAAVHQEKE